MPIMSWGDLLNNAGDSSFDVLPEGDYDLKVVKAEPKQAASGKMMYALTTEVVSGPHANRKIWTNLVLSHDNPNALGFFFRNMNAMGLGREFFAGNPSDHQVAEALIGRQFRGLVSIRKWQGQERNEIKNFYPAGGMGGSAPGTPPPFAPPPPGAAPMAPPPVVSAPAPPPAPVRTAPAAPPVDQTPPPAAPPAPPTPPAPPAAPAPPAPAPAAEAPAAEAPAEEKVEAPAPVDTPAPAPAPAPAAAAAPTAPPPPPF